jgi:prevent-host-death family protein
MQNTWQVQDAKNRLSEVMAQALKQRPQIITRHGVPQVVVLSIQEYSRLRGRRESLMDFLKNSPLKNTDLDLARDRSLPREVEL